MRLSKDEILKPFFFKNIEILVPTNPHPPVIRIFIYIFLLKDMRIHKQ